MFHRFSLRRWIALFVLTFTILPTLTVTIFSYCFTTSFVKNRYIRESVDAAASEFEESLNYVFDQTAAVLISVINYSVVYDTICNRQLSYAQKQDIIDDHLTSFIANDSLIDVLEIVTTDGAVFRSTKTQLQDSDNDNPGFLEQVGNMNMRISTVPVYGADGVDYLKVAFKYYNFNHMADIGTITAYIRREQLQNIFGGSVFHKFTYIATLDGIIFLNSEQGHIGAYFFSPEEMKNDGESPYAGKNDAYYCNNIACSAIDGNVRLHIIAHNNELYGLTRRLNLSILLIMTATALISLIFSNAIAKQLTSGLIGLIHRMDTFSSSHEAMQKINTANELQALEAHFIKMAAEIQQLMIENDISNERKRIAELNVLQSQINPHFIYNSLDVISCMAKLERPYKMIDDATCTLASFLRLGLHKGENFITVKDEMKHVQSYLAIESIRFPDLFEVRYEIEPRIYDYKILKMILQPIAENSIKHGFKRIKYKGVLTIRGYEEKQHIVFEVFDNGVGIEEAELENASQREQELGGYGLFSVRERLAVAYGEQAEMTIACAEPHGTLTTLKLSRHTEETLPQEE